MIVVVAMKQLSREKKLAQEVLYTVCDTAVMQVRTSDRIVCSIEQSLPVVCGVIMVLYLGGNESRCLGRRLLQP